MGLRPGLRRSAVLGAAALQKANQDFQLLWRFLDQSGGFEKLSRARNVSSFVRWLWQLQFSKQINQPDMLNHHKGPLDP